MTHYFYSVLSIAASHVVFFVVFSGIGFLIKRLFWINEEISLDNLFLAFWSGFGAILFLLIVWNFSHRIDAATLYAILSLGIVGLFLEKRQLILLLRAYPPDRLIFSLLLIFLLDLGLAHMSLIRLDSWDDGLYHIQAVQWANSYPAIKGIANLYGPLGFNSASFLYFALINQFPFSLEGFYIANSLLVFALLAQIALCALRFFSAGTKAEASDIFYLALVAPLASAIIHNELTSYSTDLPATLVLMVSVAHLYSRLSNARNNQPIFLGSDFIRITILLAALVSLKTSIALFSVIVLPLMLLLWILGPYKPNSYTVYQIIGLSGLIAGTYAVVWLARGIILSGYPLFPSTIGALPVDWRAPEIHAVAEMANIAYTEHEFSWSIGPNWIRHVIFNAPFAILIPSLLTFVCTLLYLLRWKTIAGTGNTYRYYNLCWWLLLPLTAAIIFWFFVAPATRYAIPLFWSIAALSLAELYRIYKDTFTLTGIKLICWLCLLFGFSPLVLDPLILCFRTGKNPVQYLIESTRARFEKDIRLAPMKHKPDTLVFTTHSGVQLNVPKHHAKDANKCWNAAIPCTSNPSPNLMFREPGNIAQGFKVEGKWNMIDWPYYWRKNFMREFLVRYGYNTP